MSVVIPSGRRRGAQVVGLARRLLADSLLRNSGYMMATTLVTAVTGYLYWILATHLYPAREIGLASSLVSVMILVSNMATMGIGALLVQELPRQQTDRAWSTVITAGLVACTVASMFAGMVAAFILPFISGEFAAAWRQAPYAILLIISMPIWSIATLLDQLFIAERSAGNMLARNTAFAVLKLALLATPVVFIQTGATSIYVTWILGTAASIIGGIVLVVRQLKHVYRPVFRGMGEQLRSMFSSLVGHHLISVASLAPMYLLSVFVAARLNAADAGYFYTTWMLGSMFFMVSYAVATSLFADGSHHANALARKVRSSVKLTGICLAPPMLLAFFGGRAILSLFGPSYAQQGLVLLWILAASAIPDAVTNIYVSMLRVRQELHKAAVLNVGMAAVALALAWILLPIMGLIGAGVAWSVGQLVGCLFAGVDMLAQRYSRAGSITVEVE